MQPSTDCFARRAAGLCRGRCWTFAWSVAVAVLLSASPAAAQIETARISGAVTDSTGALVPQAKIRIVHISTGRAYLTSSNGQGQFLSQPLPIGEYRLEIEADGFKKYVRSGVLLEIQETAVVNAALELGTLTEVIDVVADAPLLVTTEATQGQVIDNRKIVDLPLNGRDYIQLALLSTGSNPPPSNSLAGGFSGSGMRATQNNYVLDGIDNNNNQIATSAGQAEAVKPSIDAIQEFKLMTNSFSAEHGRALGAVVNVTLKSGSNELHGTAFEFLRNETLDAKNFFDLPQDPKPPFKRNQFGFSLGGPIVKNKTFFFADYEGSRVRESGTANNTIPTPAMVRGDFAELLPGTKIYDPASYDPVTGVRQPFANNRIPASQLDPVGSNLAALYPAPNKPGLANNFLFNPRDNEDLNRWDVKINQNLGSRDDLYGRFSFTRLKQPSSPPLPPPAFGAVPDASDFEHQGRQFVLAHTRLISPALAVSSKIGWNKIFTDRQAALDTNLNQQVGLRGVENTQPGMARVIPAGFAQLGPGLNVPRQANSQTRQLISDATWIRARHSLKFGLNFSWLQSDVANAVWTQSRLRFDGGFSRNTQTLREGSSIADLVLGIPFETALSNTINVQQRTPFYDFYVHDEWRLTPRLTLNLGLRYELHLPWIESRNRWANLDIDSDVNNPRLLLAQDGSRFSRATVHTDGNNFGPRFGFAYHPFDKTVIRGGYGVYYANFEGFGDIQGLMGNPPNHVQVVISTDRITPAILLRQGVPAGTLELENASDVATSSAEIAGRLPYSQQWSFSIQRELPSDALFEIGYYANTAHKLTRRTEGNWALPGPGSVNSRRRFQSILVPGADVVVGPLAETSRHESSGNSNFHSLQLRVEKRLSQGLSLLTSYIWSKTIGDARGATGAGGESNILPQDPRDLRAERSLADEHIAHRFVTSYVYELPFGRERRFLAGANAVTQAVLGGWSVAGIHTLSSGTFVNLSVQGNPSGTGGPDRPNVLRDPRLSGEERSLDRWFDPAAFERNAARTFGNAARNLIEAPGLVNFDFAVYKRFPISEQKAIQFRFESFNFFNTPHFGIPNTQVGNRNLASISSAGRARNLQFGLKFIF